MGKKDPSGESRERRRDQGRALAGKSTLNRLELTGEAVDPKNRYRKIMADRARIERLFVDVFLSLHDQTPERIVLDLDATDDPVHGAQVKISVRRVLISFSSAWPLRELFLSVLRNIRPARRIAPVAPPRAAPVVVTQLC